MKTTLKILSAAMLVLGFVQTTFAKSKITNFNEIIEENNQAQSQMHSQIKKSVDDNDAVIAELKKQRIETVASDSETINVPTDKSLLTFSKEQKRYQPSKKENDKRLAQELDDLQ